MLSVSSLSDQQLIDTVRKATWSQMHHGIEDSEGWRHSAECEACATLAALAERLTDLRAENDRLSVNVREMAGLNAELLLRSAAAEASARD